MTGSRFGFGSNIKYYAQGIRGSRSGFVTIFLRSGKQNSKQGGTDSTADMQLCVPFECPAAVSTDHPTVWSLEDTEYHSSSTKNKPKMMRLVHKNLNNACNLLHFRYQVPINNFSLTAFCFFI